MEKSLVYRLEVKNIRVGTFVYVLKIRDEDKFCEIVFENEEQAQIMIDILQKYGRNGG